MAFAIAGLSTAATIGLVAAGTAAARYRAAGCRGTEAWRERRARGTALQAGERQTV